MGAWPVNPGEHEMLEARTRYVERDPRSRPLPRVWRAWAAALRCARIALLPAVTLCVLSGCRLVVGTAVVAVGAVGLVGYGVYKTGEVAVTGVGAAASGVASGTRSVVYGNGEYKATCDGTVEDLWLAANSTLKANGFQSVSGSRDALSGRLKAVTANREDIAIRLDAVGKGQTDIRLRVGTDGNLKKSEALCSLIIAELDGQRDAQRQGSL